MEYGEDFNNEVFLSADHHNADGMLWDILFVFPMKKKQKSTGMPKVCN